MTPEHSPLGKRSAYITQYAPELLFPIARKIKRSEIRVPSPLPFHGYDLWNAYELSWLNNQGKPVVATAIIIFPASSEYLIESKSLKLYLNSFNQTRCDNAKNLGEMIARDLSHATHSTVTVNVQPLETETPLGQLNGVCIDHLDVNINGYQPNPSYLITHNDSVTETLHSHLLKSNCLVTGQPDWGSVEISYTGHRLSHEGLLKYIISFREHNEFHEQCVERIFMDILNQCKPTELTVYARYTRRGGLDINPYRSTHPSFQIRNPRLVRQ